MDSFRFARNRKEIKNDQGKVLFRLVLIYVAVVRTARFFFGQKAMEKEGGKAYTVYRPC